MIETPTFEEAYRLYRLRTHRVCMKMLRNQDDADDACQDVFLHLHRVIGSFRGDSAFSTWLHRLTVNQVLMRIRKERRKRSQTDSLDQMQEAQDAGEGPGVQAILATTDLAQRSVADRMSLERALAHMPPGYRLALVLHDIEGFEHHEIAAIAGISAGNSKSQLHRARAWLAQELGAPAKAQVSTESLDQLLGDFAQFS